MKSLTYQAEKKKVPQKKKEMSAVQIEAQIFQLEKKAIKAVDPNTPKWYALDGKIKNLKKQLQQQKQFEFLAQ